jgi:hypothetical protein
MLATKCAICHHPGLPSVQIQNRPMFVSFFSHIFGNESVERLCNHAGLDRNAEVGRAGYSTIFRVAVFLMCELTTAL